MKPQKSHLKSILPIIGILMLFLVYGCGDEAQKKTKQLERARAYSQNSEYKKAVIEYKNVIQHDPEDDGAHSELGNVYLHLQKGQDAFRSFSRAVALNPDNVDAQIRLGQLFLLSQEIDEARKKADYVLKKSPNHIEALLLISGIQIQQSDMDSALATLEEAVKLAPKHFRAQIALARIRDKKGDVAGAVVLFEKAKIFDSASAVPYLELSRLYSTKGKLKKAEAELRQMIDVVGRSAQNLSTLGRFYETNGEWEKAEQCYREVIESSPKKDPLPLVNLGKYYARRGNYGQALESFKKALDRKKNDPDILLNIAVLQFDFDNVVEAEAGVDAVLEKENGHIAANLLKGRILLKRKAFNDALERFETVCNESHPEDGLAHFYKALCRMGKGQRRLGQQELLKAVEKDPGLLSARLLLTEYYLQKRDLDLARQQLKIITQQAPTHVQTLMLQGNLAIMEGDLKAAETVFDELIKLKRDHAPAHVKLGWIYRQTNREKEAIDEFKTALEINPEQQDALAFIVSAYAGSGQFEAAEAICNKHKKRANANAAHLALIEYLEGRIALTKKDMGDAQRHFQKAIEIHPDFLSPYQALGAVFIQGRQMAEAISQYEALIQKNPEYLPGYMTLGILYGQRGETEKAKETYQKALEKKKDFAPAANNLAWLILESGGNMDEALGWARVAKEQIPNSAVIMDTLGWIYYHKGSYLNAISELRDSVSLEPDNAQINYHLGMSYYKNKQYDRAKEYLQAALRIEKDFEGSDQARITLKQIGE